MIDEPVLETTIEHRSIILSESDLAGDAVHPPLTITTVDFKQALSSWKTS